MNFYEGNKTLHNIISDHNALLLYFYNDDCAPCISLRPKVEEMINNNFPLMELLFVETQRFPSLASEFSIYTSPVVIAFFDGREFYRWSKFVGTGQLQAELQRPYGLMFG